MFFKCRDFTREATDHLEGAQRGLRALKVRLHLLVCRNCRVYREQLRASGEVLRASARDDDAGRRMLERLRQRR